MDKFIRFEGTEDASCCDTFIMLLMQRQKLDHSTHGNNCNLKGFIHGSKSLGTNGIQLADKSNDDNDNCNDDDNSWG